MTGGVYFIQEGEGGAIKIGWAVDVQQRLALFQTGNSNELRLLGVIAGVPRQVEAQWHKRFAGAQKRSEWFFPTDQLLDAIDQKSSPLGERRKPELVIVESASAIAHRERVSRLIADVCALAELLGWSETTASRRVLNDGKEISRLRKGGGTMPATLDRHEAKLASIREEMADAIAYAVENHAVSA
jgi:uncharacterized protein YerC